MDNENYKRKGSGKLQTDKLRAVSVSNRQFVLLQEIAQRGGLVLSRLLELSQTTSGSVVRRGLVHWDEKTERFTLTAQGKQVIDIYRHFDIERQNTAGPLSIYIRKPAKRKARAA